MGKSWSIVTDNKYSVCFSSVFLSHVYNTISYHMHNTISCQRSKRCFHCLLLLLAVVDTVILYIYIYCYIYSTTNHHPQVHIVCSLAAFTPPALSSLVRINSSWNISLQWLYPGVQIGLVGVPCTHCTHRTRCTHCTGVQTGRYYQHYLQMGSLYGTIALSVERYCTVMFPFKYYR